MAESNFRYSTLLFLSSILFMYWFNHPCCQAANISNITVTQVLKDGDILISSSQNFVLGFFSPQNSTLRYVGIWYNQTTEQGKQEVVWVANRNNSLSGTDGVLRIYQGNLIIRDKIGNLFWSTGLNASPITSNTTIALLDDTGNFIYSSIQNAGDTTQAYWQSFDYPSDTYLPGMKVTIGNTAVEERSVLTSWNSASDVSTGRYSLGIDTRGSPQIVMWDGDSRRWRSGHWDGLVFIGVPNMSAYYSYGFKLSPDGSGNNYFIYEPNGSQILRFKVTWDGNEEELIWNETTANWNVMQREPSTTCDLYNQCGNFGTCNADNKPICSCIKGFEPMDKQQWNKGNWSGGCIRSTELQCGGNSSGSDGFLQTNNAKLPDYAAAATQALNEAGCKTVCLNNCSCRAYAYASGYKCLIWTQDLVDIQQFSDAGRTLHVRLAASDLEDKSGLSKLAIGAIVASGVIILIILVGLAWKFRNNFRACSDSSDKKLLNAPSRSREYYSAELSGAEDVVTEGKQGNAPEVPLFSFNTVATATNYFSDGNKLGQGGFGPVYKGILTGGQEVAVKRLSRKSGQGLEEFKNEIILIAKLQHRNLVRLLGWCVQEEEKMLIYEYMPNKSLDCFLFATDPSKRAELSWKTRFTIIEGIARGLLYLHRDSRLRIIHRDLKASNILLDEEMNPKISDFGMARIFGGNQNEANTNRVVGTYGYMSPEYAMEGLFSVKSDVYSFGVLLLEIISGRRNTSFRFTDNVSLIRHAWELWTVGKAEEVIDSSIKDSCFLDAVLRCLHVAMLCVQESASYRPNMSTVILMLESETAALPRPRPPPATSFKRSSNMDTWNEGQDIASSSDITVTMVAPR